MKCCFEILQKLEKYSKALMPSESFGGKKFLKNYEKKLSKAFSLIAELIGKFLSSIRAFTQFTSSLCVVMVTTGQKTREPSRRKTTK